ncbi:MAG: transcriptional regulator [Candidatus Diapherotrites archaeon CG11_big_fil_rev_8_21_14_0_20_37_9]|nr:MAG: transcriptional regulator [Candidatus Diapherotrites archaeon CG11_big_fil_rev_8_21_14_0_20_37_9]
MKITGVPRVDLSIQEKPLREKMISVFTEVIDSGDLILGKNVTAFEKEAAEYLGIPNAVGVANGTDAIKLALAALGIGKGDEVITTPFTMAANVEAIFHVGAKPVFADVNYETFNISPEKIREKITKKTKAILPVHLFGLPADMEKIISLAKDADLFVVEDCAQAFGSEYKEKKCGSFGELSATSFYPTKNLGGYGDGGMVFVNKPEYLDKLRHLRVHGQVKKYDYKYIGWNSRLDEIQAAILRPKLRLIDSWNDSRAKAAAIYTKELSGIMQVKIPEAPAHSKHVFHLYTIKAEKRDELEKYLFKNNIGTTINFPAPLHLQKGYSSLGYAQGDFPVAEKLCAESISLPMFVGITKEQISYVAEKISSFYN